MDRQPEARLLGNGVAQIYSEVSPPNQKHVSIDELHCAFVVAHAEGRLSTNAVVFEHIARPSRRVSMDVREC